MSGGAHGGGPIVPVLLAAGSSSRFADGHKLLAPLGGESVVRMAARALVEARMREPRLARPIVVTGARGAEVEAALAGLDIEIRPNRDHRAGMGTSIAVAAGLLREMRGHPESSDAPHEGTDPSMLLALGDMPAMGAADHLRIIGAHGWSDPLLVTRGAVETGSGLRPGHPVLFGPGWIDALAGLDGDRGAGTLMARAHPRLVPLDPLTQHDVDTREALEALARAMVR